MLRALEVRDFVLIEQASLELAAGFTALTGETGAGKSILVDAIELLVGGRADAAFVREGAERAELSGEFDVSKAMEAWLAERDLAGDPGSVVLRRSLDPAGRSRCFVNGHAATLAQLKEAGEWLVDLHGQHAHQSLLRAAAQRELLDAHAAAEALARETAHAFRDWQRLEEVVSEASAKFAQREAERADIAERVADLTKLAPREGEWQRVAAEHKRLQHGSSLLAGAQSSLEALAEAEGAALAQLGAVASRLRALSEHDSKLRPVVELLDSAEAQTHEAVRELRHYASRVELDPDALRAAEARIEALLEAVEFEVASHPSLPLRPLAKVASGGELSRISLAIQLVAAKASPVGTLVFDEVDAGIGGAVAQTIGRSLKRLGKDRQVLCVTHLPQVAASADAQWSVAKSAGLKIGLQRLDRAARIDELARMLGGAETTARKHAAELLDN